MPSARLLQCKKTGGYAALVEYGGKRILFDTGNNPDILAQNAKARGIDLSKLDFVVMSHRHGDHMGGLGYALSVNPKVPIYAPKEGFGVYGADLPGTFYRKDPTLAPEQRYRRHTARCSALWVCVAWSEFPTGGQERGYHAGDSSGYRCL